MRLRWGFPGREAIVTDTQNPRAHPQRVLRSITWEGNGQDRRYTVARELYYWGNPDAIDETGSKAAEHMALADALRALEQMIGRANLTRKYGACLTGGRKDYEALVIVVRALRAKRPD